MMTVALTGNAAAGKSSVGRLWAREGVPVVSADELARQAVEPGSPGLEAVVSAFGREVLRADGSLDRDALRDIVFRDPDRRERLEAIVHPSVRTLRAKWMERREAEGRSLAVAEIPLLFEVGLEGEFHVVVMVHASYEVRLGRLTRLRGLEEEEARRILDVQIPSEEKVPRATFVIPNASTPEDLAVRALALLDLLRARAAARERR